MSDPEVSAFEHVIRVRNGGGGQRRIIAGSVREPKAIMRNVHLDFELQEKKKRIDAAKNIHMRNLDHRKLSLRMKLMERNAQLHEQGILRRAEMCHKRGKNDCHNMKLLMTLQDGHIHARTKSDLRKTNASSCILHPTSADDPLADVRPRAISLESYFRQQSLLQHRDKLRSRDKLAPNRIQTEEKQLGLNAKRSSESQDNNFFRGDRVVLPDILEHRRGSLDSNSLERDVDSALSGRLSQSGESIPREPSPQPESGLPMRRVSRLRSVTIARTLDLEGMLARQKVRAAEERVRRRSDERAPDSKGLIKVNVTQEDRIQDEGERFGRKSYKSMNQYASEIEEADRMFRMCRFNSKDTSKEHLDFDREVSKISNSFVDIDKLT